MVLKVKVQQKCGQVVKSAVFVANVIDKIMVFKSILVTYTLSVASLGKTLHDTFPCLLVLTVSDKKLNKLLLFFYQIKEKIRTPLIRKLFKNKL